MSVKNIIVENIKTSQRPKYVWKIDVSVLNVLSGRYAIPKRKETGDIKAGNYKNKPFLKESFYTLKNNIGIGEKMNCEKCMERSGFSTMELTDADSDGEGMVYETYTCPVCGNVQYDAFRI